MDNPIKENRVVANHTFAVRLISFISKVTVNDAASEEEKEALLNIGKTLLKYQCLTASEESEISYLKRVGEYEENVKPLLVTEDGVAIHVRGELLWTCLYAPEIDEEPLSIQLKNIRTSKRKVFYRKQACQDYIENNSRVFTRAQLRKAGVLEVLEGLL